MILKTIQETLQQLYRFELEQDVDDFSIRSHRAKEALVIVQRGQDLQIGLFIPPSILRRLKKSDPFQDLTTQNLWAFCVAVEGVSHFVYFLKRVEEERPVTRLELELQAEVDKYLLAYFLLFRHQRKIPSFLFSRLFEEISFDPTLQVADRKRYLEANRLATKFCAHLDQNYLRYHRWDQALEKARHFYELDHWAKIAQLTP